MTGAVSMLTAAIIAAEELLLQLARRQLRGGATVKPRIPLAQARDAANDLAAQLAPVCTRVTIAGSIRRQAPTVGDIELVVEPIVEPRERDLWGTVVSEHVPLDDVLATLRADGDLTPRLDVHGRAALGARYQRLVWRDIPVDLFIVRPPAQWGLILAIRTGPGEFSRRLVTHGRFGGLLPDGWRVHDGGLYDARGRLVPTPEEIDVFRAIGSDWIEPWLRW